jgi:hypothetical protein
MQAEGEQYMRARRSHLFFFFLVAVAVAATLGGTAVVRVTFAAQAAAAAAPQKTFSSPDEAAKAYVAAVEKDDTGTVQSLLGPGSEELINSGDEAQDKRRRERFTTLAKERSEVRPDPYDASRFLLYVGNRQWPLPIPIVKDGDMYRFDASGARTEILARRVGRNELDAIALLREIVQAEIDYAYADKKEVGMRKYADKIISDSGKHDGLYWETKEGETPSPLEAPIAKAIEQGYELSAPGDPFLYHGYIFRILKGQGSHAMGGARDYVVQDKMIGGFAAVAYPVEYASTGVKTFMVNQDGVVQEKDLGPSGKTLAASMKSYDPDKTWKEALKEEPEPETASKP